LNINYVLTFEFFLNKKFICVCLNTHMHSLIAACSIDYK